MGIDRKDERFCDECGHPMAKAHRIEKGREYCATCYKRCFARKSCTQCKDTMRVLKALTAPPGPCGKCVRATRLCLRCGLPTPRAGRRLAAGVVCNSCAKHFRPAMPCEGCGNGSRELSTYPKYGIGQRICRECFRQQMHATCAGCSKNRLLAHASENGTRLCASCRSGVQAGEVPAHPCPGCNTPVRGFGASLCQRCLNAARLQRLADSGDAQLDAVWVRRRWAVFVQAMADADQGDAGLAGDVERSLEFFRRLQQLFPQDQAPGPELYAARVDGRTMRKFLLASRCVASTFERRDLLDEAIGQAREHRCIEAILAHADGQPHGPLTRQYANCLDSSNTSLRTRRQYLRAAVDACRALCYDGSGRLDPAAFLAYLRRKPGQHANLSCWHRFLLGRHLADSSMPRRKDLDAPIVRTGKEVRRLRRALGECGQEPASQASTADLARMFSTMFGVPAAELIRQRRFSRRAPDGSVEVFAEASIACGSPSHPYALRWMELARTLEVRRYRRRAGSPPDGTHQ